MTVVEPALLRRQAYVDGAWIDADSGETFPVTNPATGETIVGGEDVVEQAKHVFRSMGEVLAAADCGFPDVVKVTVFLTDVDGRPKINPVREEIFGETRPASTLVEVPRLAVQGAKVEVECVALVPS